MKQNQSEGRFIYIIYIILCAICAFLLPVLNITLEHVLDEKAYIMAMPVSGCLLFQIQLIMLVLMLIKYKRKGYYTDLCICTYNITIIIISIFKGRNPFFPIALTTQMMDLFILSILYKQLISIDKGKQKVNQLSTEDPLTGLPNRTYVQSYLSSKIAGSPSNNFSLLFIDLDNFKIVNDSLGHEVGDIFLKETANNLRTTLRGEDFLGRMGGDEFIVIIPGEKIETEVFQIAKRLSDSISNPVIYRNKEIRITASFGITQFPKDGTTTTELLQRTDMAMYRGKALGKQHITFYNDEMQKSVEKQLDIENELHFALENKELYLVFQPQFSANKKELRGYEALARWNSHKLGAVGPSDFIPVAERTGDIVPIGKWIIEQACSEYSKTFAGVEDKPILAINISARQFQDPDFVDSVKRIIKKTEMDTHFLEFEITESVCIMNPEIILGIFAQLKNMGIEIALDDFGTGYSSLSYLSSLPFDIVKIDISFTRKILTTPPEKNLIQTIITMAHQLNLKVIAEGVEVKEQLDYLISNDCDYIQGNYFSLPINLRKELIPEPAI